MVHNIIEKYYYKGIEVNDLIRLIWVLNPDIQATTIIRHISRLKNKVGFIVPDKIPIGKQLILKDMKRLGIALTFKTLRKYGISVDDITEINKINHYKIRKH